MQCLCVSQIVPFKIICDKYTSFLFGFKLGIMGAENELGRERGGSSFAQKWCTGGKEQQGER